MPTALKHMGANTVNWRLTAKVLPSLALQKANTTSGRAPAVQLVKSKRNGGSALLIFHAVTRASRGWEKINIRSLSDWAKKSPGWGLQP